MDSLLFNNHHPSPKPQPPPPSQLLLDRRAAAAAAPAEKAPLPCPRCESTNTKFCYYNNYNLSQPRHFCKACRRYWTRGGTLRNVPVGGGTRKSTTSNSSSSNNNNKRPRVTTPAPAPTNHHNVSDSNNDHVPHGTQTESTVTALDPGQAEVADVAKQPGSLSSCCWWSGGQMGAGFLPTLMNGYELGLGYYEQPGALDWPNMDQVRGGDGTTTVIKQHHQGEEEEEEEEEESSSLGFDTWQVGGFGGGDHSGAGGSGGDFLSWPELAISTSTPAAEAHK